MSFKFEKLLIWQKAMDFGEEIFKVSQSFPKHELFGIASQMRRAASSISSNLSEGSGRSSSKDHAHLYQMTYSSNLELLNHFNTALDLNYIKKETFENLRNENCFLSFKINALRNSCLSSTS